MKSRLCVASCVCCLQVELVNLWLLSLCELHHTQQLQLSRSVLALAQDRDQAPAQPLAQGRLESKADAPPLPPPLPLLRTLASVPLLKPTDLASASRSSSAQLPLVVSITLLPSCPRAAACRLESLREAVVAQLIGNLRMCAVASLRPCLHLPCPAERAARYVT